MNSFKTFSILDYLDKLEPTAEGKYKCLGCGGHNLSINKKTGAYTCWNGCECEDIREAIAPLPNSNDSQPRCQQTSKRKPIQQPKPPAPSSADINLARLPAPVIDTPQPQKDFDREHGEVLKTTYIYSLTLDGQLERWIIRTDWDDPKKSKGRDKTFRQWHRSSSGENIPKKGEVLWEAYRIDEFIKALKNTPGIPAGLVQEGEGGVEVSRAAVGIASTTFQGSAWKLEDLERTLIRVRKECPNAILVFLRDNDATGEKKARDFVEACDHVGIFSIVVDPVAIYLKLPDKGDIVEILAAMDSSEFIKQLEKEIHKAIESRRDSLTESIDIPDNFDPDSEFTQKARRDLYGDKHWLCLNSSLHYWTGTYYKVSLDVVESQRLWHYCNGYAVEDDKGNVRYPYATPSWVKKALEWVKLAYGVDPALIDPAGVNCTNGVIQLSWVAGKPSFKLVNHDPALYYTYEPAAPYNPNANPEHCDRLLEVLAAPQREIFLRTVAASLDLPTVRRFKGRLVRALLLKGDGNNGKDTLREIVAVMYGNSGMTSATLTDFAAYDEGRKFPLSRLNRSRVNWASENANFAKLDKIQSLKAFVTGDPIDIEGKGRDSYEFTPVGVGLFNINDTPNLTGALEAILSRYGVLIFSKTFKIGADPSKGELEADPRFKYDRDFLRFEVLPAFLNRVLAALGDLMSEGIDYSCTQQALEDIQRENSHLFQFCQDTGLRYDPNSILLASEIWDLLEQWYQDNGTLSYEEGSNGKRKATWNEQPRKSDPNVKAVNQVIARFTVLLPKAKVVTVPKEKGGKPRMGLQGIGFTPQNTLDTSPNFIQVSLDTSPNEPLQDKSFHPSHPIVHTRDEKNEESDRAFHSSQTSGQSSEEVPKLGDLGEKVYQASIFGSSNGCNSSDATLKLGDGLSELRQCQVLVNGEWQLAVLLHEPNNHPDPKQRITGWKVRFLSTGRERYFWNAEEVRRSP